MSIPTAEQPAEPPEEPGLPELAESDGVLFEAVRVLDESREQFLGSTKTFAQSPTEKNGNLVADTVGSYIHGMSTALDTLGTGVDPESYVADAIGLVKLEDALRVKHLNEVLGTEVLQSVGDNVGIILAEDFVDDLTPQQLRDTIKTTALRLFSKGVGSDVEVFMEEVATSKVAKRLEFRKQLGSHALDFAKMTAAVALGILITRRKK